MRVLMIGPCSTGLTLVVLGDGRGVGSLTPHNWDGSPDQRRRAVPTHTPDVLVVAAGENPGIARKTPRIRLLAGGTHDR